jgi:hypothetical protein
VQRVIGFFSFTEVTDPGGHRAYNKWHQFDHLPEQFSIDGIVFGQRWVATPACRAAGLEPGPLLSRCHYMTLYLMRDVEALPEFFELAVRLREEGRFFAARISHLSGPFTVDGRWVAPGLVLSVAAVPFRPAHGIYVVVGRGVDGERMAAEPGVAGAWSFSALADGDGPGGQRHITVAFIDGDLFSTAANLGKWLSDPAAGGPGPAALEWAAPLEVIDANQYDWFDRLTPQ